MSAELTISGLTIVADNAPAIYVEAGAALNLTVEGENLLTGDDGFAGICVEPGWDQSGSFSPEASGRLVIQGMGSLSAQGGDAVSDAGIGGGAGIGAGNNNNFAIGEESARLTLNSSGTVIAYGGMGAQAIGMGTNPPSDKSYEIEIGNNAEIVWMFNYDQVQSAVYGVSTIDTMNFSELSVPYHTIFWHNGTDTSTGGSAYACKENGTVDGTTYSWSTSNDTVFITEGSTDILSGSYDPDLHDACDNWAVIYRAPEPEPVTIELAPIIITVGGAGYESTVTTEDGNTVVTVSDGLPEPGFTVELPEAVDAAPKEAGTEYEGSGPLDLSKYLSFSPFGLFWKDSGDPTPPPVQTPTPTQTPTPVPTPEVPDTPPVVTDEPVTTPSPTDEPSAPSAPVETPAPSDPGVPDEVPATGDTTSLGLWLTLSGLFLLGLLGTAFGLRRRGARRRR